MKGGIEGGVQGEGWGERMGVVRVVGPPELSRGRRTHYLRETFQHIELEMVPTGRIIFAQERPLALVQEEDEGPGRHGGLGGT